MIAIIRLLVFGLIVLSVVYLLVSLYSRSERREKLEKAWDTDPAREGLPKDQRDAYIEAGVAAYNHSLRRKCRAKSLSPRRNHSSPPSLLISAKVSKLSPARPQPISVARIRTKTVLRLGSFAARSRARLGRRRGEAPW